MISVIAISTALLAPLVLATVAVLRKLDLGSRPLPVTAQWIDELSADRYRPMMRLLDSRDIEFLRAQPGYTREMEKRLRAQRCQLVRGYLRCLETDFQRVCVALKLVLLHSEQDRPDLSAALLRQQFRFATRLAVMRFRLLLCRYGICTVDVLPLVQIFDGMRHELRTLVPASTTATA